MDDASKPPKFDVGKLVPPTVAPRLTPTGNDEASTPPADPAEPAMPAAPVSPLLKPPAQASSGSLTASPAADYDGVFTPAPSFNPVVAALKAASLYGKALDDRLHTVVCPWAAEHPTGVSFESTYEEPTASQPIGRFRCEFVHPESRNAASLIHHLGLTPSVARAKPRIRILAGEAHLAIAAAEKVLASDGKHFHAGGPIIRLVWRSGQGIATEAVNDQTLKATLSGRVDFERLDPSGRVIRCDPSQDLIQGLMRGQDRHHLKALAGLAHQPFFRPDGSLVTTAGFDGQTGIYAAFDPSDYDLGEPTREMAERELDFMEWLLDEFCFGSEFDRSAAVCAMLTAAVRPSLPQAPAFSISATTSGSGKSYLAKIIVLMAGPGEPYNTSFPTKPDEATKLIIAMLLEKPAVILFDDMQTDWKSFGALNKALTSPTTTERQLGSSRTITANTNVLFLGTGNNILPDKDMRRRVVTIHLAPDTETPALSVFNRNPVEFIRRRRTQVVRAALTIISAFKAAGAPMSEVPPIGTFEEWSASCRQAMLWLGRPDPATSLIEQVSHGSDQEALSHLLDAWTTCFGFSTVTVRKVVEKAQERPDLMDALIECEVTEGFAINQKRLGWFLRKNAGRRAGGYQIERVPSAERLSWKVSYG